MNLKMALCVFCLAWGAPGYADEALDSFYRLTVVLTTQAGAAAGLDLYRGHPVLISLFYGSCPAACPMLITAMQTYENKLSDAARARLRVVMVSFDAQRDTPARLLELAQLHGVDASRWTFSSAPEHDARKLAALLGIQYRQLPNREFDHSLLITLLDREGRVLATTSNLYNDETFFAALQSVTAIDQPSRAARN
jgi:protein SCO1/2